jgi:hypothetical protein
MDEIRSSAELVRHLIVELSRFTGMRGAVVTQALYDAGFPEEHLPSRPDADRLTGEQAAIGWKARLTRHELDVAMAVLFLRTRYRNGRPGGLLLMWHPTTRWLFVRATGARKAAEPDFHRWIDRRLIEGVTRFARLRCLADQQKLARGKNRASRAKRSDHHPAADPVYVPRTIYLSNSLRADGYEPDFSNWRFEPSILVGDGNVDAGSYNYDLRNLPGSIDPHEFIRHIVDGYNFADFSFTIGRRGKRGRVLAPMLSVPLRLGIAGYKGRRWRNLLRMPVFGTGKSKRGPFESSRRGLVDRA